MSAFYDTVFPNYERVLSDIPGCDKYKFSVCVIEMIDRVPGPRGDVKMFSMFPIRLPEDNMWFFSPTGDGYHGWKHDPFVFRISNMNVHANVFDNRSGEEGDLLKSLYFNLNYGVVNASDVSDGWPSDIVTKVVFDQYLSLVDFTFDRDVVISPRSYDFGFERGDACMFMLALNNMGLIPGDNIHFGIKLNINYELYVPKGLDFLSLVN